MFRINVFPSNDRQRDCSLGYGSIENFCTRKAIVLRKNGVKEAQNNSK